MANETLQRLWQSESRTRNFNNVHNITREVVENAFGRLQGTFRSIGKRLDLNVENSCVVISDFLQNYRHI